jgi:poly(A) polymerase
MSLLKDQGIQVIPTGIRHGTFTAVIDHRPFEITTLRRDIKTYGRHAKVIFDSDWLQDASRRDFTINGLYAHIDDGTVEDYHHGIKDLFTGTIQFIGHAHQRIQEDYLRILRYFRFFAWYGQTPPTPNLLHTLQTLNHGLKNIARERIHTEFLKLLKGPKAKISLNYMIVTNTLSYVTSLPIHLSSYLDDPSLSVESLLYSLFIRNIDDIETLRHDLRLSNRQYHHLISLYQFHQKSSSESLPYLMYLFGEKIVSEGLFLQGNKAQAQEVMKQIIPPFPIKGLDIHLPPGPQVGMVLKACQRWWANEEFRPTKEECLAWIKNYLEFSKR